MLGSFQELEGAHVGPDPGDHLLIFVGFGVGIVAGAEHRHEQRGGVDFAGLRMVKGDGRARPIDEQLLARTMFLAQDQIAFAFPPLEEFAEAAVTVAIGMCGPVLSQSSCRVACLCRCNSSWI